MCFNTISSGKDWKCGVSIRLKWSSSRSTLFFKAVVGYLVLIGLFEGSFVTTPQKIHCRSHSSSYNKLQKFWLYLMPWYRIPFPFGKPLEIIVSDLFSILDLLVHLLRTFSQRRCLPDIDSFLSDIARRDRVGKVWQGTWAYKIAWCEASQIVRNCAG